MISHIEASLLEARQSLDSLISNTDMIQRIADAGHLISQSFKDGGKLYSCGNGGSMCDAMHLAEELTGRFRKDRKALGAIAIADGAHLSCTANDFGYESVFSRFIEGHGRKGDVLVAISTSGKSPNVIKAAREARKLGMLIVSLTGKVGSELSTHASIDICTPGGRFADRVQELHIKVIHIMIELIERELFDERYV